MHRKNQQTRRVYHDILECIATYLLILVSELEQPLARIEKGKNWHEQDQDSQPPSLEVHAAKSVLFCAIALGNERLYTLIES